MSISFDDVKTFGAVLSALIASRTIWELVRAAYVKGWGSRSHWRKQLDLLANLTTDDYVEELLGKPVFLNYGPATLKGGPYKDRPMDRVYSTPHAWVVTRSIENQVRGWSVTITDPKFWWEIGGPTHGQLIGRLGRTTFASLLEKPTGRYELRGARTYAYAESMYFGGPGAYQTYVFMHNSDGVGEAKPGEAYELSTGFFMGETFGEVLNSQDKANATRQGTTVNTLLVTPPIERLDGTDWMMWPVVNSDQARLVHRYDKRRGWHAKKRP